MAGSESTCTRSQTQNAHCLIPKEQYTPEGAAAVKETLFKQLETLTHTSLIRMSWRHLMDCAQWVHLGLLPASVALPLQPQDSTTQRRCRREWN